MYAPLAQAALFCHEDMICQAPGWGEGTYPGSCSAKGASFLLFILGSLLALGLAGLPKVLRAQRLRLLALQPQSFRLLLFRRLLIVQLQDSLLCSVLTSSRKGRSRQVKGAGLLSCPGLPCASCLPI